MNHHVKTLHIVRICHSIMEKLAKESKTKKEEDSKTVAI